MKIAICDDEKFFRTELRSKLDEYAFKYGYDFSYYEYSDGQELLYSKSAFDLIFMDFQMKNINGIDTVAALRKRNIKTVVIFISSFKDVVFDCLIVQTFRFLVKPLDYEKLSEALSAFITDYETEEFIILKDVENDKMCRVSELSVIYAEADDTLTKVRTFDHCYQYNQTLSSFEKNIKSNFFYRTHRAFLINFNYIQDYSNSEITFENGEKASLTKTKFKKFQNAYFDFLKRKTIGDD